MIVNNIDQASKYLPSLNISENLDILNDALAMAQDKITEDILGSYISKIEEIPDSKIYTKVARAISLLAFYSAIGELDVLLSDAGFVVAENSSISPASKARVDKLISTIEMRLTKTLDEIVTELRSDDHKDWRETEQAKYFSNVLVCSKTIFAKAIVMTDEIQREKIPHSWEEYYSLIPTMQDAITANIEAYVTAEYTAELQKKVKECSIANDTEREVYNYLCKSIVAYTLRDTNTGNLYAIRAKAIMAKNPDLFPTFTAANVTVTESDNKPQKIQNFL